MFQLCEPVIKVLSQGCDKVIPSWWGGFKEAHGRKEGGAAAASASSQKTPTCLFFLSLFFREWPPAQSNYTDRRSRSASAVTSNPASDDSGCWMLCRPRDKRKKRNTKQGGPTFKHPLDFDVNDELPKQQNQE